MDCRPSKRAEACFAFCAVMSLSAPQGGFFERILGKTRTFWTVPSFSGCTTARIRRDSWQTAGHVLRMNGKMAYCRWHGREKAAFLFATTGATSAPSELVWFRRIIRSEFLACSLLGLPRDIFQKIHWPRKHFTWSKMGPLKRERT